MTKEEFKKWRASSNLSGKEFADYLGYSQRMIRNYENGSQEPPICFDRLRDAENKERELILQVKREKMKVNYSNRSEAYLTRLKEICKEQIQERKKAKEMRANNLKTPEAIGYSIAGWSLVMSGGLDAEDLKVIEMINEELERRKCI